MDRFPIQAGFQGGQLGHPSANILHDTAGRGGSQSPHSRILSRTDSKKTLHQSLCSVRYVRSRPDDGGAPLQKASEPRRVDGRLLRERRCYSFDRFASSARW